MKNNLLKLVIAFCLFNLHMSAQDSQPHCLIKMNMCAQENPFQIVHSQTGLFKRPGMRSTIRYNETSSFKVYNINPFLYKVEVNGEGVSLNTDMAAFNAVLEKIKKEGEANALLGNSSSNYTLSNLFIDFPIEVNAFPATMARMECYDETAMENLLKKYVTLKSLLDAKPGTIPANSAGFVKLNSAGTSFELTTDGQAILAGIEKQLAEYYSRATSVITPPLQVKGNNYDLVKYHVKYTNMIDNTVFDRNYEYYITGGWKFDVSTGVIATGLIDHIYYTRDTLLMNDSVAKKMIYENLKNRFGVFGLTALGHLSYRATPFFKFGICAGVAGTTDIALKYLFGGSLVFGAKNRFCFNGGVAFGKVKELDPGYAVGGYYEGSVSTVPTIDVYHYNWFVGITYSITKGDKNQEDKK